MAPASNPLAVRRCIQRLASSREAGSSAARSGSGVPLTMAASAPRLLSTDALTTWSAVAPASKRCARPRAQSSTPWEMASSSTAASSCRGRPHLSLVQALEMLDVDRRVDVDPGGQELLHVLPALLVARAGGVGVGELVDQGDLG